MPSPTHSSPLQKAPDCSSHTSPETEVQNPSWSHSESFLHPLLRIFAQRSVLERACPHPPEPGPVPTGVTGGTLLGPHEHPALPPTSHQEQQMLLWSLSSVLPLDKWESPVLAPPAQMLPGGCLAR